MNIYVVQPGDTVDKIAQQQRADLNSLIEMNQLIYPYRLAVGQALLLVGPMGEDSGAAVGNGMPAVGSEMTAGGNRIPAAGNGMPAVTSEAGNRTPGEGPVRPSARGAIFRSGYAYPFISPPVLAETLPYLSELPVFSYGFTVTGDLIPPALDDRWMVEEAGSFGTAAALTLTPLGADGHFNNNLVSVLVRQQAVQRRLVAGLTAMMLEKGYEAVNIDFEYVLREDRDLFTGFVAYTTRVMNLLGYQVSVALAPKYSDSQQGLLYEGMDYGGLGAAANWVVLMTYEWGYTYDPIGLW